MSIHKQPQPPLPLEARKELWDGIYKASEQIGSKMKTPLIKLKANVHIPWWNLVSRFRCWNYTRRLNKILHHPDVLARFNKALDEKFIELVTTGRTEIEVPK